MEVVGNRVLRLGNHVDLISHHDGHVLRHIDDERIVGHETGVEHSLAVVEIEFIDTAQVATDERQRALGRSLQHQFSVGIMHVRGIVVVLYLCREAADIVDRGCTVGHFVFVRLVFA